ncbi:MAG: hypothetical protein KDA89_11055, partial [Planctomycetaceae bacterium]|nr:hypothetical protein [Planctomycetaceae bacterium]
IEECVTSDNSPLAGIIDVPTAGRIYRDHLRGTGRHGNLLWALLVLGRWMDTYSGARSEECEARGERREKDPESSSH